MIRIAIFLWMLCFFACSQVNEEQEKKRAEVLQKNEGMWGLTTVFSDSVGNEPALLTPFFYWKGDTIKVYSWVGLTSDGFKTNHNNFFVKFLNDSLLCATSSKYHPTDSIVMQPTTDGINLEVSYYRIDGEKQRLLYQKMPKSKVIVEHNDIASTVWYGTDDKTTKEYQLSFDETGVISLLELDRQKKHYLYSAFFVSFLHAKEGYYLIDYNNEMFNQRKGYFNMQRDLHLEGIAEKTVDYETVEHLDSNLIYQKFRHPMNSKGRVAILNFNSVNELELSIPNSELILSLQKDTLVSGINKHFRSTLDAKNYANSSKYKTDSSELFFMFFRPAYQSYMGYWKFSECLVQKKHQYRHGVPSDCKWTGKFRLSPRRDLLLIKRRKSEWTYSTNSIVDFLPIRPTTIAEYDSTGHWFEFLPPPALN